MVGGTIKEIHRCDDVIRILVVDGKDSQWRTLEYNSKTRAIGVGEGIWWQSHKAYWSVGKNHDIKIGRCYPSRKPRRKEIS